MDKVYLVLVDYEKKFLCFDMAYDNEAAAKNRLKLLRETPLPGETYYISEIKVFHK